MRRQAFLTDLDGTLLRSDATLSSYTIDTVTRLLNDGVPISYATARSYRSSHQVVSAIPWTYPLVLYNGALLFDPAALQVIDGFWLSAVIADEIMEIGRNHRLLPLLFALTAEDEEVVLHEPLVRPGERQFYESRPNDPRFRQLTRLVCPREYKTLILTYIGLFDEVEPLSRELAERYGPRIHMHLMNDFYLKDHYFLEVSHANANKKEGLRLWARYVGVDPAEITVFGDNLNDVGMFEAAGTRIAVHNAHEQLKSIADLVIGSNEEDAVAYYLTSVFVDVK
jgi:5-amino-6-(5-phospho-D-ribitylamino)uracil phosphatase